MPRRGDASPSTPSPRAQIPASAGAIGVPSQRPIAVPLVVPDFPLARSMTAESSSRHDVREPWLSVIVPVWNRADTLGACLDSVLQQARDGVEIVAVDDASDDGSLDALRRQASAFVRVFARTERGGPCAARALGIEHARGTWVLFLDSDDALCDGALDAIATLTRKVGPDVGVVGLAYRFDDGRTSPDPQFPPGDVGFEDWLRWRVRARETDFLPCHRREIYDALPMPRDGREGAQLTWRIASRWKMRVSPRVGGLVHTHAANRHSRQLGRLTQASKRAHARMSEEILDEFGDRARVLAPHAWHDMIYQAGWWCFAAGERRAGTRRVLSYLRRRPASLRGWGCLVCGWLHPNLFARLTRRG